MNIFSNQLKLSDMQESLWENEKKKKNAGSKAFFPTVLKTRYGSVKF